MFCLLSSNMRRLINLATSPGVRFKQSSMPFVQMENISLFLRACEMPPLNLPSHDRFLTVDLYDSKDPAQVLQCLAAFSRRANVINSSAFPRPIGAKSKGDSMSPQGTGASQGAYGKVSPYTTSRPRGTSNTSDNSPTVFNPLNKAAYSGRISPTKTSSLGRGGLASGGSVSSWSNRADETKTAPAWNIHQYGYMGGASQGNQGVAFGARRQITSAAPSVPTLAEKEKQRKEEAERRRLEQEEDERRLQAKREAEDRLAREDEERRWQEETQRMREQEEQARKRDEGRRQAQERREAEEREEREREAAMAQTRSRQRTTSDARLNGQFLSQYHAEQFRNTPGTAPPLQAQSTSESQRIADLERQLEEMRARERQTQNQQHSSAFPPTSTSTAPQLPTRPTAQTQSSMQTQPSQSHHDADDDWSTSERSYLKSAWESHTDPQSSSIPPPQPPRPLPNTSSFTTSTSSSRVDRYLSTNPAPPRSQPTSHRPTDYSTTTEVDLENSRRLASQTKTKAGGWASKSLLEREMERERDRQREWEESQKATAAAARDVSQGTGPGQSWDVHQYGYTGGDSQNRGGHGLGVGGARRQIIGPRPPP